MTRSSEASEWSRSSRRGRRCGFSPPATDSRASGPSLRMVENTLQGMWHGIYDRKDEGFFRYAVSRDWKVPHYEKMLVSNASLAVAYLEGFQIARKASYRVAAEGILQYLMTTLYSPGEGLFFASQDADEPFYQMSWKDRSVALKRLPLTALSIRAGTP